MRDGSTFRFVAPEDAFNRYMGTIVVGKSWPRWKDVVSMARADGKGWAVVREENDMALEFVQRGALPA